MQQKTYVYLIAFCFVLVAPLTGLGVYVYSHDPYWVFHTEPEWVKITNGHNRVLDMRHYFAKTLQVVTFRPDVLVLGSSRVYRGIPTNEDLFGAKRAYNLGISMMMIQELRTNLIHALRWTSAREVIIGLDFFMFDSTYRKDSFDERVSEWTYVFRALLSSLITMKAYEDTRTVITGQAYKDGYWTRSGFIISNPRSGKRIEETFRNSCNGRNPVTEGEYQTFREILNLLSEKGIQTSIFISPLNSRLVAKMKSTGQYQGFLEWKARTSAIASEYGLSIYDFSEKNPFFDTYPIGESNRDWIDSTHYSPSAGRWIIHAIQQNNRVHRMIVPQRAAWQSPARRG